MEWVRQYQHIAPAPLKYRFADCPPKKGIASSLFTSLLSLFFSPLLPSLSSSLFAVLRMLCLPGMQDTQLGHPHHLGIHELIVGVNVHQSMYMQYVVTSRMDRPRLLVKA